MSWRSVGGLVIVWGIAAGACAPPVVSSTNQTPPPPTSTSTGNGGQAPTALPTSDAGRPACGKQLEGPDIPCPDAGAPPPMPPPATPDAATPLPPTNVDPAAIHVRAWGATFTGVYLKVGETADITATGRWHTIDKIEVGPEGVAPNYQGCPRGALVARMAKFHQRTCIGAHGKITAKREGFVWLYQSEGWNGMDSSGELLATVTGGARPTDRWHEGLTPISIDPRVDPARIAAFEPLCGRSKLDVFFGAEQPDNPRVQAYVRDYFGGDVVGWISRALVRGCALFYDTPADYVAAWGNNRRGRLVHWVGDADFPGPHGNGDFELRKSIAEITSMQPDYGPYGGPPVSIMHEAGHWLAPDGGRGTLPKWLAETYAESLPSNIGDDLNGFHNAIDNPESPRFGATWWWCDGTFGGATFVDWIDEQHPGFLHALTKASIALDKKPWTGSPALFQQLTGQTFDQLFAGYSDAYDFAEYGPGRPVTDCLDPRE